MKRRDIHPFEAAPQILSALPGGVLMTTRAGSVTDTMIIGWGTLGIDWGTQIFTAFVRESRYTKELVDANPYFTVSIPVQTENMKEIVRICGTKSGRDIDKFKAAHLDLVESDFPVPAIRQLPLTLECEVVYSQDQDPAAIDPALKARWYPQGDYHTVYVGRIHACYMLEED